MIMFGGDGILSNIYFAEDMCNVHLFSIIRKWSRIMKWVPLITKRITRGYTCSRIISVNELLHIDILGETNFLDCALTFPEFAN